MFHSTRLKLTAWYLVIIMVVSCLFSIAIYQGINSELGRFERFQGIRHERLEQELGIPIPASGSFDPQLIAEARNRLKLNLLLINLGILTVAGAAGYFLAGRTLQPIAEMVDEQNRFVTDASHELRTPLTSLKSEIEVNLRDKNLNIGNARRLLKSNLEEVNSLQNLSDSLIRLTQYQKTINGLNFERVSLISVLTESVKKVMPLASAKKIKIVNLVKDIKIEADKQSIGELFVILLDNAIKYSPQNTKISINSKPEETSVAVSIKDQGYGIAKREIPHLFDRFYRGDKSRTKINATGYGLGLSIAKQIVDKHNGLIKVESEKSGSVFTVVLSKKHR